MEIDYDKMKEYSERARVSFSKVIEAMNNLAEAIKKVAEDLKICNTVLFNIQEIRISTEKREQLNRKCYMCELDERYCDVIINRWERFTGGKAVKLSGTT